MENVFRLPYYMRKPLPQEIGANGINCNSFTHVTNCSYNGKHGKSLSMVFRGIKTSVRTGIYSTEQLTGILSIFSDQGKRQRRAQSLAYFYYERRERRKTMKGTTIEFTWKELFYMKEELNEAIQYWDEEASKTLARIIDGKSMNPTVTKADYENQRNRSEQLTLLQCKIDQAMDKIIEEESKEYGTIDIERDEHF